MATPFRLKRSAVADRRPTTTDLQLGELALNTHDGFLYAETTGVGSTVSLLTPWREQYGSPTSIYYNHRVGIGSTNPTVSLDVVGDTKLQNNLSVTGLSTFSEGIFIPDDKKIEIGNAAGSGDLQLFYDSTPGESFISHTGPGVFKIQGNGGNNTFLRAKEAENSITLVPNGGVILHYDGGVRAETTQTGVDITDTLKVAGISTFSDTVNVNGVIEANSNVNVDGNLDVDGYTELDDLRVSGISTFSGSIKIQTSDLSKRLLIGDIAGSPVNYLGIQQVAGSSIKGFATQHLNASVFENLQGSIHQHLVLGDSENNNTGTLFGISITQSGTTYERLKLTGVGDLTVARDLNVTRNLDVDGRTELDITNISETLNVTGVSTFSDNIFVGTGATVGFGTTAYFNHTAIVDGSLTVGSNHSLITGGSPTDQGNLAVYGSGKNSLIIQTTSNGDDRGIAWRNAGDAYVAYIAATNRGDSTADLRFGVDASNKTSADAIPERMRITREGNVGINSTSPTARLDVDGNVKILDGALTIESVTPTLTFNDTTGTPDYKIRKQSGHFIIMETTQTNDTEYRLSVRNGGLVDIPGDLNVDGNAGIGSLSVTGISTFSDNIFVGTGATVGFGTTAYFRDNARAVFGDDEDLSIYHDGEQSYLSDQGTGGFRILTSTFRVRNPADNSTFLSAANSYVSLNHDGDQRLKTTEEGVLVSGGTTTGTLNVTGISTFGDVVGFSSDVNVGGLSTSTDRVDVNVTGNVTITKDIYLGEPAGTSANTIYNRNNTGSNFGFLSNGRFSVMVGASSQFLVTSSGVIVYQNLEVGGRSDLDKVNIDETLNVVGFSTFRNTVSIAATESTDAILELIADEGDDNVDKWRIRSTTGNDLKFESYASGAWSDGVPLKLGRPGSGDADGIVTIPGQARIGGGSGGGGVLIYDNIVGSLFLNTNLKIEASGTGIIHMNDNVGINSASATHELEVLGDTSLKGNLNVTGITSFTDTTNSSSETTGAVIIAGGVGISKRVNLKSDATINGILYVQGAGSQVFIDPGSQIDCRGNLSVDGRTELDITNISETLNVTGISTFTGQVGFGTHIILEDYSQIRLGEKVSGGNRVGDFFISHNPTLYGGVYNELASTNGNILLENRDTGANKYLYLKADRVQIRSYSGNEAFITCHKDADVSLFYDNSERFKTTVYGALLTGGTSGIGTLAGPATFHIDPAAVGDNTGTVVIKGNLQIDGTTTTVNSTTVTVDDKNLVLASGAANDAAASGGGITIESGDGNKTFTFESTGNGFQSSEHFRVASGKVIGFAAHTGTFLSASASGGFVFTIGNNEKARIRSSGDVNIGTNLNVTGVSTFSNGIFLPDNKKAEFGNAAGNANLEIFHDGSNHSYIRTASSSAGGIIIKSHNDLQIRTDNLQIKTNSLDDVLTSDINGNVSIGNSLSVAGVSTFSGAMNVANGSGVIEDAGGQLKIKAGTFNFRNNLDNKNIIFATGTGGVILYNQGQQKLETLGFGATVYGTTQTQQLNVSGVSTFSDDINASGTSRFEIASMENALLDGEIAHTGDTDTKIVFGNNEIDLQAAGSSRFKVTQFATYVQSGHPLAFLSASGPTPNIKSGGTNNQDLLFTTGTGNPTRIQVTSAGNVGINSTSPTHKLEVLGDSSLKGNLTVSGISTFTGKIIANSNVGIGTDNPAAPLHISGPDAASARLLIEDNNNGIAASEILVQNGGRDLRISAANDIIFTRVSGGTPLLYLENGQNVGIGTEDPSAKLDVYGASKFNDDVTFQTANGLNIVVDKSDNALEIGKDVKVKLYENLQIYRDNNHGFIDHVGGSALKIRTDMLRINDIANDHSMIHADRDSSVKLFFDNTKRLETTNTGVSITDNLNVAGISTFTGNIHITGVGSSVGIGTDNPSSNLQVYGDIRISNAESGSIESNAIRTTSDGKLQFLRNDPSNNTPTITIDDADGNVGIGTDIPKQKLEVFSGAAGRPTFRHTGGFGGLQIAGPQPGSGAALMFARSYDVVGGGLTAYSIQMAGNTQGLHFISGDPSEISTKTRLFLNSAGSVGINTSNPRQKLHLDNGYMFVRGDSAPQVRMNAAINDTSSTRFTFGLATGANNFFNGAQALDGCVAAPSDGQLLLGVGVAARMYILNSGDITINRTSQLGNTKLSLQCDPAQEGIAVNLNQNSGISTAFAIWNTGGEIFNLAQDTDSTPDLIFKIKNSGESAPVEKVRFRSNGNVGIGTDVPDTKLHVTAGAANNAVFLKTISDKSLIQFEHNGGSTYNTRIGSTTIASGNVGLRFETGTSGARLQAMVIDRYGKVGIATGVPTHKLEVDGNTLLKDNLSVAGLSTFSDDAHFKDTVRFQDASGSSKVNFFTFGRLQFNDNVQAAFGNSSQARIGSDGSDLTISNNTGGSYTGTGNIKIQADAGKESIVGIQSGAVELYHNDVKRFETTNTGVDITDNLKVAGISTFAGVINSTVSTGTAPFTVASTTKVTNLNADLLDGKSTANGAAGNTVVIRNAAAGFSAGDVTFANITAGITTNTGVINSQTDIRINNVSVIETALNDAVAMAIALG